MFKKTLFVVLGIFIFISCQVFSQTAQQIKITAQSSKSEAKAGEEIFFKVNISIIDHWYTYSFVEIIGPEGLGPSPSEVKVIPEDLFEKTTYAYVQKPEIKFDSSFRVKIEVYKHNAEFIIPVKLKKDFNIKTANAQVALYLQLCDTVRCLPGEEYKSAVITETFDYSAPKVTEKLKINFTYSPDGYQKSKYDNQVTAGGNSTNEAKKDVQQTESSQKIEETKKEGILSYLWLSMLMGGLSLLTPCVFPMIPITVSFFTKRAEKTKGKGLRDSLVYSLGIILTFTLIGVLVSIAFGPTGISQIATNGWVNLAIAAVFMIFALNLFGAFEIQIPTGLVNALNSKSQGSGIGSILIMGFVFSLTSFTCTVPFVGTSLVSVSKGEWFYPIIGMLGFSTVFASPFFVLALIPSLMNKVPKAGGWMNNVKVVMGFIEIAAAIKFFSNADLFWSLKIIIKDLFLIIWIVCSMLITIYILGGFRLHHDSPVNSVGTTRLLFATFFAIVTIWLFTGLIGKSLGELDAFMPPKDYGVSGSVNAGFGVTNGSESAEDKWFTDYNEGLKYAKENNKKVFIDFTGWQCTNCRWMEFNMFTKNEVNERMKKFVKIKLYTDNRTEVDQINKKMQQDRYGSIELPLYVIMSTDEKSIATKTFTRDLNEFLVFLDKGLK